MRNLKLVLEYDGTDFHGFQRQPRLRTVQGVLERALSRLLSSPTKIIGAGRTDAGVHALGQGVNFVTGNPIPVDRLAFALNRALPSDMAVRKVEEVPLDFHARRSARSRRYRYAILNRTCPAALASRFATQIPDTLDVAAMQEAAQHLIGEHDFRAFQAAGSETRSTRRVLSVLKCLRRGELVFTFLQADSFLYQMVRIMVASLLRVARGEWRPSELRVLLDSRDRGRAPGPVPPQGLCLTRVSY